MGLGQVAAVTTFRSRLGEPATIVFEEIGGVADGRKRKMVLTAGEREDLERLLTSFLVDRVDR